MPSRDGAWHDPTQQVKTSSTSRTRRPCSKSGNKHEVTTLYGKLKEGTTSAHDKQKKVTTATYQPLEGSHSSGSMPGGHTQSLTNHKEGTKQVYQAREKPCISILQTGVKSDFLQIIFYLL